MANTAKGAHSRMGAGEPKVIACWAESNWTDPAYREGRMLVLERPSKGAERMMRQTVCAASLAFLDHLVDAGVPGESMDWGLRVLVAHRRGEVRRAAA